MYGENMKEQITFQELKNFLVRHKHEIYAQNQEVLDQLKKLIESGRYMVEEMYAGRNGLEITYFEYNDGSYTGNWDMLRVIFSGSVLEDYWNTFFGRRGAEFDDDEAKMLVHILLN